MFRLRPFCRHLSRPKIRPSRYAHRSITTTSHPDFVDYLDQRKLRGAVLDFSGTIVDPGVYAPAVVFRTIFERFGVPISMEEAREPMGNHKKVHIQRITEMMDVRKRWNHKHGRDPTEQDVEAMFEQFVPAQLEVLPRYAKEIPGAFKAANVMRNKYGLQLGNTTGFTRSMVDVIVAKMNEQGFALDFTVAADEVENPRPFPDACVRNMRLMNIKDPAEMVKIGDTQMDVEEGKRANMWTIALRDYSNYMGMLPEEIARMKKKDPKQLQWMMTQAAEKLMDMEPDYIVDNITDALPKIEEINERLKNGELPGKTRSYKRSCDDFLL